MQSVFTDFGKVCVQDAVHSFTLSFAQIPVTSSTWLSTHGHAHFALATPAGGISVVTLPPPDQEGKHDGLLILLLLLTTTTNKQKLIWLDHGILFNWVLLINVQS